MVFRVLGWTMGLFRGAFAPERLILVVYFEYLGSPSSSFVVDPFVLYDPGFLTNWSTGRLFGGKCVAGEADWEPGSLHTASDLRHGQAEPWLSERWLRDRRVGKTGKSLAQILLDRIPDLGLLPFWGNIFREPTLFNQNDGPCG